MKKIYFFFFLITFCWFHNTQANPIKASDILAKDSTLRAVICQGESYTENGFNIATATAGMVYDTLTSVELGCDSTVYLELTILPTYDTTVIKTICSCDLPYTWNDVTFNEAGSQATTLETVNGCDSVVRMTIKTVQTYTIPDQRSVCENELPLDWDGFYFKEAGTQTDTTRTDSGCFVVTKNLTVNSIYNLTDTVAICVNELPYIWNHKVFDEAGSKIDTLETVNGCDSIVTLTLKVNPVDSVHFDDENICAGNIYSDHGFLYEAPYSTVQTIHYDTIRTTNTNGCDSIVTLTLTVNPVDSLHFDNETICAGNTYSDHGFTYEAPYITVQIIHHDTIRTTNTNGCDSIVTLTLMVNPVDSIHFDNETVCAGNTYSEHGFTFDAPYSTVQIIHYDTIRTTNTNGCDSIVTLILTVDPVDSVHFDNETVCAGNTYSDHGFTFDAPYSTVQAIHYDTIRTTNTNGCDSIVTLTLTVDPVDSVHFDNETVCAGNTYSDHGFIYEAPYSTVQTIHYDTIRTTNTNGCDSIVTLTLTVNPVDSLHFDNETICAGNTYSEHGFTFDAPYSTVQTIHYDTIHTTNANGCDSIVTLTLTVNPSYEVNDVKTICVSALPYTWNGVQFTQAGMQTATLETVDGCDSIVTMNLTVSNEYRDTLIRHICEGSDYLFNDTLRTTTGFYVEQNIATNHCDSITVLHLIVHQLDTNYYDRTICLGNTFTEFGFDTTLTTSGSHILVRTIPTRYQCDSTIIVMLTVNPVDYVHFDGTICDGETYSLHGFTYTAPFNTMQTIHYDTIRAQNVNGCDSIVTLTLTIFHGTHNVTDTTVCDSFTWTDGDGKTYTNSGTYTYNYNNDDGCPSVDTLHLTVHYGTHNVTTVSECGSYTWTDGTGQTYSQSGTYMHSYNNNEGCPSVDTLKLTIWPIPTIIISGDTSFCEGSSTTISTVGTNSYKWSNGSTQNSITINEAGIYSVTATNSHGCTSSASINIIAKPLPPVVISGNTFICQGDNTTLTASGAISYTWKRHNTPIGENAFITINNYGTYTVTGTSQYGCTKTASITVTVKQLPEITISGETDICQGDNTTLTAIGGETYMWGDDGSDNNYKTVTSAGTYSVVGFDANGCAGEASVTVHVWNAQSSEFTVTDTTCYTWNHVEYCETGDYTQTLQTSHGCDSIVTLHLYVFPNFSVVDQKTICESELPIIWNDIQFTQAGTQTVTLPTEYGSDSVVTMILKVNPTYDVTDTKTICASELPITWNGVEFTKAGTQTTTLETVNGCDSVVTMTLTTFPTYEVTDAQTICPSELPYTWNGVVFTQAGTRTATLETVNGCDSVVTMTLTTFPTYEVSDVQAICPSELPYIWNDIEFTQAGTQTVTLPTVNSCDSVVTMTLTVNPVDSVHFDEETVCAGGIYSGHGFTYEAPYSTMPTIYYDTIRTTNVNGCDSIVTLTLTVNPVDSIHFDEETVCSGNTYSEYGFTFDAPYSTIQTIYYDTIRTTNANGCDSIVTLTLTVNPVDSVHFDHETVCAGNLYSDHGFTYKAPYSTVQTIHYDTIRTTNANGCDSIVTLTLTVNPVDSVHFDEETVCAGNLYSGHGFSYEAPYSTIQTIHYDTIRTTNANGCDSIVTLILTVNPVDSVHFDEETVCAGNLYSSHGFSYEAPYSTVQTIHYDTIRTTNANGCDSIVTLTLTVNPVDSVHFDDETICAGNTYSEYGFTFDAPYSTMPTIYYDTIRTTNANGCDSIVTLTLTVNPVDSVHFDEETVCAGNLYSSHGFTYEAPYSTMPTIYYDTIRTTNANGCDSIVTLTLTVNPIDSVHFDDETICAGNTYADHGFTFDAPYSTVQTIHYDTIRTTNANGCDSIVTLTLTVNPVDSVHFDEETICAGSIYSNKGFTYKAPYRTVQTIYYDTIRTTNTNGCDSIVTLTLTVNPVDSVHFDHETVCAGNLYSSHGFTYEAPYSTIQTIHYDTIRTTNANGCDSIVTLTLTVNPVDSVHFDNETICAGNTYSVHGFTYEAPYSTMPTIHYDTIRTTNANGCDSIVTLILMVNPSYKVTDTQTICPSELPYTWNGVVFTQAGTQTVTLPTVNNCDSVVTMTLATFPTYEISDARTICPSELPYTWNGVVFTQAGTQTTTLETVNGCDSVVTMNLTTFPTYAVNDARTICPSELPYTWNGVVFTKAGTKTATLETVNGCDSVVTMTLTTFPTFAVTDTKTICPSELPYTWNGVQFTQAGTRTAILQSINGCDSVVTMTLTTFPTYAVHDARTICPSELPYTWNGVVFSQAGTQTVTLPTVNNCDSVVTMTLTTFPTYEVTDAKTICASELPYTWNGVVFTQAGTQAATLETVNGCDSVVTMTLTVNPTYDLIEYDTICQNDLPYTWRDTIFEQGSVSGVYVFNRITINQCDSTVSLNLTIHPSYHVNDTLGICDNELPYTWNGVTFTQAGTQDVTLPTINGCDSVVTMTLLIRNTHTVTYIDTCDNSYTWTDGNGRTYTQSGTYTYSYYNEYGCASSSILHLTIRHSTHNATAQSACDSLTHTWTDGSNSTYSESGTYIHYYQNAEECPSTDTLTLTINHSTQTDTSISKCDSYTWLDGNGRTYTQSGTYNYSYLNEYNCPSYAILRLTILESPEITISGNEGFCEGDSTTLTATGGETYAWNNGSSEASISINNSGTYIVTGTDINGCTSTSSATVVIWETPNITISGNTDFCEGSTTTLTAHGGETYIWNNGSTGAAITVNNSGTYIVTGNDENGCTNTASISVNVWDAQSSEFFITDSACYSWNGVEYCETGDYIQTFQTIYGCDSIVTLHYTHTTVNIHDYTSNPDFHISIYPNPTLHAVDVKIDDNRTTFSSAELYDATGRRIKTVKWAEANSTQHIDMEELSSGIYFIRLYHNDQCLGISKVIKQQ